MRPMGGRGFVCAYQLPHQSVATVRTVRLSRTIGITRSHNILRAELDSHADTCVVGRHASIIHEHDKVMVSGFDPSQPARRAKVVDAAIKYTQQDTGDHLILMVNQAILVPQMSTAYYVPCNAGVRIPLPRAILS